MAFRDIVVIGASAGGVETLQTVVSALPADFQGSVFITVHFPENGFSVLPQILARRTVLPVAHALNQDVIVPGKVYIAPPNHHLIITRQGVRLVRGPRENGSRPAADPMFRSAALSFGPRVIGVVLTGNLDDGTAGLAAIKRGGGLAVVQDPADALFGSMPQSAIDHVAVDRVVPAAAITSVLAEMMAIPIPEMEVHDMIEDAEEDSMSEIDLDIMNDDSKLPGEPSPYSCPDCGGVLRELHDGTFIRYRCRVGHAWSSGALAAQQVHALDDALWTALRALEESVALSRQLAVKHRQRGMEILADRFTVQAESTERKATIIRRALVDEQPTPEERSA